MASNWVETGTTAVSTSVRLTCVCYDPHNRLVWVGDTAGCVRSFYGPLLLPYSSYVAHTSPVKCIQVAEKYVLSLGNDGVKSYRRSGVQESSSSSATGDALLLLNNSEFLVGFNRRVKRFSLEPRINETGHFTIDQIPENVRITHLGLCAVNVAIGLSDGSVAVVEPVTFDMILPQLIKCHTDALIDLNCRKNMIATCGSCKRKFSKLFPDVFATCFDVRAKKQLPPFTTSSGASFVRLHPKSPNHAVVLSPNGFLTFLDNNDATNVSMRQVLFSSNIVGMDINSIGDCLIIAEENRLHHWSTNPVIDNMDSLYGGLTVPTSVTPLPYIAVDDLDVPLSYIGLPYFNQSLLSAWSPALLFETGMPVPDWSEVKSSLVAQSHESSKTGRHRRRASSLSVPKFLSEKERLGTETQSYAFVDVMKNDDSAAKGKVPKLWRQVHIHYSKFGVDDFDFSFYNSTQYSGLETLSNNPHCNAVLQLLRWCIPVYNNTLKAFAENNYRDLKLTGELAIVFDMLAKAEGHQCRAANFMDTLQLEMGILSLLQTMIQTLFSEFESEIGGDSPLRKYLETKVRRKEYGPCGMQNLCESKITTLTARNTSVLAIQASLSRTSQEHAYCIKCRKVHQLAISETVLEPPPVLFVQITEESKVKHSAHEKDKLIPAHFGININNGGSGGPIKPSLRCDDDEYILQGYVSEVQNEDEVHAVAVIKIGDQWFLFNDFLVSPISEHDALDFSPEWKKVRLLMYYQRDMMQQLQFDDSWKQVLDTRMLYENRIISGNLNQPLFDNELLKTDEPIPELVALDAEFVLVKRELSELFSDGSKTLISPKKLGLARISVLRDDESVLLDDRVESTQPILDYFTAYSGVEPGDLDKNNSKYGLVSRQTATRRLWILLNKGSKFVGHALINDFRTINIYVPPSQFIDTAQLYRDKDRNGFRILGLKFLIWAVFGDHVQTGNHDSVQDAQSALRLYRRYEQLMATNSLDDTLADISAKGQKYNFKVPEEK